MTKEETPYINLKHSFKNEISGSIVKQPNLHVTEHKNIVKMQILQKCMYFFGYFTITGHLGSQ